MRDMEDRFVWKESKGGSISFKAFYSCLEPKREVIFLVVVWNLGMLTKVGFFAWKVAWGGF